MPFNYTDKEDSNVVDGYTKWLGNNIVKLGGYLTTSKLLAVTGNYSTLINTVSVIVSFEDRVSAVQSDGLVTPVRDQIITDFFPSMSTSDLNSFVAAIGTLRTSIVTNSTLFEMTFDNSGKPEFITPLAAGVQSVLMTQIDAILDIIAV